MIARSLLRHAGRRLACVPPPSSRRWVAATSSSSSSSLSSSSSSPPPPSSPRVCVVGSGPGGFYTAKYLLKENSDVRVDVLDALPTPFGLVRSGVAPDHPEVKSVQNDFAEVARSDRFQFLGNVEVGRDVSLEELRRQYHAVVLAYGASSDRALGIPGESLAGVRSARAFVNWYNGHPAHRDDDFGSILADPRCEDVVLVGQGNVAIDCARLLCKSADELRSTDIAAHALEALAASRVRRVHVLGRRGHVQASFTMKELREATRLPHARFLVAAEELAKGRTPASLAEIEEQRAKKRMDALLEEVAVPAATWDAAEAAAARSLRLRFFLSPTSCEPHPSDATHVGSVRCAVTRLVGELNAQRAEPTGAVEAVPAFLVLRSVGYRSVALPGVPFDEQRAVVRQREGRVVDAAGAEVRGLYCAGWLKRGPSGIIGTNIPDARETVAAVLGDIAAGRLPTPAAGSTGLEGVRAAVARAGRTPAEALVSWEGWRRIDAVETGAGAARGKPREKLTRIPELVAAAAGTLPRAAAAAGERESECR